MLRDRGLFRKRWFPTGQVLGRHAGASRRQSLGAQTIVLSGEIFLCTEDEDDSPCFEDYVDCGRFLGLKLVNRKI